MPSARLYLTFQTPLDQENIRQRLVRLGGWLNRNAGLAISWNGYTAHVSGSYMMVNINGTIDFRTPGRVVVDADDPGALFRGLAESFLRDKFNMYLNPSVPLESLPS